MGEVQGALFYLQGFDSESLQAGNDAFTLLLEKHSTHQQTDDVRFLKVVNAGRTFKTIAKDKMNGMVVRPATLSQTHSLMMSAASGKSVVDDLTEMRGLEKLARIHLEKGDEKNGKVNVQVGTGYCQYARNQIG